MGMWLLEMLERELQKLLTAPEQGPRNAVSFVSPGDKPYIDCTLVPRHLHGKSCYTVSMPVEYMPPNHNRRTFRFMKTVSMLLRRRRPVQSQTEPRGSGNCLHFPAVMGCNLDLRGTVQSACDMLVFCVSRQPAFCHSKPLTWAGAAAWRKLQAFPPPPQLAPFPCAASPHPQHAARAQGCSSSAWRVQ